MSNLLVAVCSCTAKINILSILISVIIIAKSASTATSTTVPNQADGLKSYIVAAPANAKPVAYVSSISWYKAVVARVTPPNTDAAQRFVYSYQGRVFEGFVAKLSPAEAAKMRDEQGLNPIEDKPNQLHTTRTPEFLGLYKSGGNILNSDNTLWTASKHGQDVIIGLLDTGIWPERKSFNDTGYTPVPPRWKGTCESHSTFHGPKLCNRKLIGARSFYRGIEAASGPLNETLEFKSPRDMVGHGTHTASTAAGTFVADASLLGVAAGTASGVAPRARIAVYKACWSDTGCYDSDILAAFEAAISDGVDIISVSFGGSYYYPDYSISSIALGSFYAAVNGILTVASAGNAGPSSGSVDNAAPWMVTVAASTIDRRFLAPVTLGNGLTYDGESLYVGAGLGRNPYPLVYAGDYSLLAPNVDYNYAWMAAYCANASVFDQAAVSGKVLLCDRSIIDDVAKGFVVRQLGGVGMILASSEYDQELSSVLHVLPATSVTYSVGVVIKSYIDNYTTNATVILHATRTLLNVKPAPAVASFSSRGPNQFSQTILKPDVTAPGVNILAAFTGAVSPSGVKDDKRRSDFGIFSGTSMSCPHVSGLSALLKAAHPSWSPAAIRSAIMTTTYTVDNTGGTIKDLATGRATYPTAYGAGHINPNAALNPGLIYDITPKDYMDFLCSLNYTDYQLASFTTTTFYYNGYNCSQSKISNPGDLNYPSFSIVYSYPDGVYIPYSATFTRTVTNVGPANTTYTVSVNAPKYVSVFVSPSTLSFSRKVKKLSYKVTFAAQPLGLVPSDIFLRASTFGSLTWSDASRGTKVVSPIAFTWSVSTYFNY